MDLDSDTEISLTNEHIFELYEFDEDNIGSYHLNLIFIDQPILWIGMGVMYGNESTY